MMISRLHWVLVAALIVVVSLPTTGLALEKTSRVASTEVGAGGDGWRAATSCSVAYYNLCTGWFWGWSGWSPNDILGVVFDACCPDSTTLNSVSIYVFTGSPSGYGFTGTLGVFDVDGNNCPTGPALWSQAWLPPAGIPEVVIPGGVLVGASVAVAITAGTGLANPLEVATDHPAIGPTGPQACGFCYASTRVNRSFYWGSATVPLCPGSSFFDDICDSELIWDAKLSCSTTSVETSSWATVKSLYR